MNRDLWSIYLGLQTKLAYGGAESAASESPQSAMRAAEHLARVSRVLRGGPVLVVGPGGPDEVVVVESAVGAGTEIHVLTAHGPEADWVRRSLPNVQVAEGDMHNMPYETGVFSVLFASNVMEHALAPYIALMECRRVLAGGAIATFVIPSFEGPEGGAGPFHLHCLTKDVWHELLRKTGYAVADYRTIEGRIDRRGCYHHYVCTAGAVPHPHDRVFEELVTYKAAHEPNGARLEAKV